MSAGSVGSWRARLAAYRPQFSLMAGLIAVTLVAVWLGRAANEVRRQSALISAIEQREGIVSFQAKRDLSAWLANPLRGLISDEFFREPASVNLRQKSADAELLRQLTRYRRLQSLDLRGCDITNQDVMQLKPLERLISLDLSRTQISDAALETIGRFRKLRHLDISENEIHGPGLRYLSKLSHLRSLNVDSTHIGDGSLLPISQLVQLSSLNLSSTLVSDDGLVTLSRLTQLEQLALDQRFGATGSAARITQRGMEAICRMQSLTHLSLVNRIVSDNELQALERLPHLRYLHVGDGNPEFSRETMQKLQTQGVQIYGAPSDR